IMKKSTLFKKTILIISLTLILGLLVGCTIIIPIPSETGTVHVNIYNDNWKYRIYLDSYSYLLGTTDYYGQKTFYNVSTGYHTFYAEDVSGFYSGQKTQYIHSGTNYVNIFVY
ncbi:MAG: hypothetical protein U9N08_04110, partial [Candidatus Caldatribacteriota bacterium]|nr:hypothetical protein [Candidatus Caldatribacteriota bacterium]